MLTFGKIAPTKWHGDDFAPAFEMPDRSTGIRRRIVAMAVAVAGTTRSMVGWGGRFLSSRRYGRRIPCHIRGRPKIDHLGEICENRGRGSQGHGRHQAGESDATSQFQDAQGRSMTEGFFDRVFPNVTVVALLVAFAIL